MKKVFALIATSLLLVGCRQQKKSDKFHEASKDDYYQAALDAEDSSVVYDYATLKYVYSSTGQSETAKNDFKRVIQDGYTNWVCTNEEDPYPSGFVFVGNKANNHSFERLYYPESMGYTDYKWTYYMSNDGSLRERFDGKRNGYTYSAVIEYEPSGYVISNKYQQSSSFYSASWTYTIEYYN